MFPRVDGRDKGFLWNVAPCSDRVLNGNSSITELSTIADIIIIPLSYADTDVLDGFNTFPLRRTDERRPSGSCVMDVAYSFVLIVSR